MDIVMKRTLALFIILISLSVPAFSQVFIINDNMMAGRLSEIKATVVDSLTSEPIGFASVYVIPSKDTTITNFTLSDAKGEAKLDEVPYGSYVFHVEMMGYKPFVKEKYFRERRVDMGTIRLQVDEQYLQAAVVSGVGNPIVVKQDTVEFNASSFRVGANAMLKDLLQRMPGMEITEDGKVKFNGEEIDHLTVGGRTFFFDDQSTALNNLPASVVDKIRVIDRESEATRSTGIQDGAREKVLDVALKKEYEKGWFGNAGAKGGTTLGANEDEQLRDNRGFLFSGNALVSAYTDKDQVTVIGNVQNVDGGNGVVMIIDEGGEATPLNQGLSTAAQLGINANTTRIKNVESTVGANYKYSDTDSGSRSFRTTYQDDGDLTSSSENFGKQYARSATANMEFKKEKGKVWFHLRPSFRYGLTDNTTHGNSETNRNGSFINASEKASNSQNTSKMTNLDSDISFREIGNKKGRTVRLSLDGYYSTVTGHSSENSLLRLSAGSESRSMQYDTDGDSYSMGGSIAYTEPLGEKWKSNTSAGLSYSRSDQIRDAFDEAGRNDYYSSVSQSSFLEQTYRQTFQYKFGEQSWITLGAQLSGVLNETYSKSFGVEETTGKDEWNWFVTPRLDFQHGKGNDRFYLSASGYTQQPSSNRKLPVLNIADPSRLSLGNTYLKPYTSTSLNGSWDRNNREKFSTLMMYFYTSVTTTPISTAMWYDPDGILYSIPVNTKKPSLSGVLYASYTTPLDAKKHWFITVGGSTGITASTSYQAKGTLKGLDKETFNYTEFMTGFWGDEHGSLFYSGKSGFAESDTRSIDPGANINIRYNQDRYNLNAGASTSGRIVRYSLDPTADMNTLTTRLTARGSYTTKHEFEIQSDLNYVFYKGFSEGYGAPEWQWNASVSKNIGPFNLSITAHDILDQTRNLTHTVTNNYEEDTYRLILGRYILFGVKWNFGKMNAAHSRRAQNAAWDMVW